MIFETTAGEKVEYGPVALDDLQLVKNVVEEEYRERGEPIDPPTYKVEVLGSTKERPLFETHPHTAETIDADDVMPEEKAAWDAHLDALQRMGDDMEDKTSWIFLEAIKVELPKDDGWIKRRKKLFNQDVPEDKEERLLFYVNNVLLKTPADKNGIMEGIFDLSMSGTSEEVKQAYKDLFRGSMEQAERQIIKLLETIERPDEKMVLQPVDAERDGSQGVEDITESVQETSSKR